MFIRGLIYICCLHTVQMMATPLCAAAHVEISAPCPLLQSVRPHLWRFSRPMYNVPEYNGGEFVCRDHLQATYYQEVPFSRSIYTVYIRIFT